MHIQGGVKLETIIVMEKGQHSKIDHCNCSLDPVRGSL